MVALILMVVTFAKDITISLLTFIAQHRCRIVVDQINVVQCYQTILYLQAIPENQIYNRIEMNHRDYYIYRLHHMADFDTHQDPNTLSHRPCSLIQRSAYRV